MLRLFRYLQAYRRKLWLAVGAAVLYKVFDLMPPFLTAWFIDTVSGNVPAWISDWTSLTNLWHIVLFLTVLSLFIFIMESLMEWLLKKDFLQLAQEVQHDLRMDAYESLQSRELGYFEEQRTGNLMAMLNDDVNQLERFLNSSFKEIIQLVTLFLVAGWALLSVSVLLGLIGLLPVPFIILGSFYYQKKVAPYYRQIREGVGMLGNRLENNISGISVIKSFTTEKYETERVRSASQQYRDANFRAIRWSSVFIPVIRLFIALGFVITMLIGAYWILNDTGQFSLGSLAFFAMMIQRLLWPVTRLGAVFDEFERARASARRIFTLIDTPNQMFDPDVSENVPPAAGRIEFQNVYFEYKKGQPVLQDISLAIEAGQTIGIAGSTGGGKTTLIKLLLRFYDVTQGSILLEGIDLRQFARKELRQQIGLVSQEVYLFHGSSRENIAYGMPHCSEDDLVQAAQKAELHSFIEKLPDGYDTIIGERGIKLSGGQRQRLSIARTILKDAPILILDEATSAVDTETERAIQQNLNQLTRGKTAIIIAHRLSTIRHADRIVVLHAGRVAEQGTHEALLAQNGIYADLWRVQTGEMV